jgi:hypothetical protein
MREQVGAKLKQINALLEELINILPEAVAFREIKSIELIDKISLTSNVGDCSITESYLSVETDGEPFIMVITDTFDGNDNIPGITYPELLESQSEIMGQFVGTMPYGDGDESGSFIWTLRDFFNIANPEDLDTEESES